MIYWLWNASPSICMTVFVRLPVVIWRFVRWPTLLLSCKGVYRRMRDRCHICTSWTTFDVRHWLSLISPLEIVKGVKVVFTPPFHPPNYPNILMRGKGDVSCAFVFYHLGLSKVWNLPSMHANCRKCSDRPAVMFASCRKCSDRPAD